MIKKFSNILNWIVFSNFFVAFCVLSLTISSEVLLGTINLRISQFVFFATLLTYNFQRVVKLKQRQKQLKTDWQEENKTSTYFIMIISAIIILYYFYYFKPSTQIAIIFSGILSLLYPFRIRNIPFVKIFVIALVWTISTMLLLILENNMLINQNLILHLSVRFLFVFAISIPFDIRDLRFDDKKMKTIPIVFGERKAKLIGVMALFFCELITIVQMLYFDMEFHNLIALICIFFLSAILIIKSSQAKTAIYFSFWVESLSIYFYLFLILSTLLL